MSDAATSSRRAEANRRNAQKSTGPRTKEGKDRSRFNAVKHGLRAKSDILPGEDAKAFGARLEGWTRELDPRDEVERFLVGHAVRMSWQLDRANRAIEASMADAQIAAADRVTQQAEEAIALGLRLLEGSASPTRYPGDPNDPMRLVNRLEANAVGCAWLLDRWDELRTVLDDGGAWGRADRIRAIGLLGHRPIELIEDDRVLSIYVYSIAIDRAAPSELVAIADRMEASAKAQFLARVDQRKRSIETPEDAGAARSDLLGLIAEEAGRLEELLEAHLAREESSMAGAAIDASLNGERVRRYQTACDRSLLRVLNLLGKRRVQADTTGDPRSPVPEGLSLGTGPQGSVATAKVEDFRADEPADEGAALATEGDAPQLRANPPRDAEPTNATNEPNDHDSREDASRPTRASEANPLPFAFSDALASFFAASPRAASGHPANSVTLPPEGPVVTLAETAIGGPRGSDAPGDLAPAPDPLSLKLPAGCSELISREDLSFSQGQGRSAPCF